MAYLAASIRAAHKVADLSDRLNHLSDQQVIDLHQHLVAARDHIVAQLASKLTGYQTNTWETILQAVDLAMRRFERQYATQLGATQVTAWQLGNEIVDAPLTELGFAGLGPVLSPELPRALVDYSADLIKNITDDARGRLTTRIRLGLLSSTPMAEIIRGIGTEVDKGVFATVLDRATTIAHTEVTRAAGAATAARLIQAKLVLPDLRQQWDARRDSRTRPAHRLANGEVVDVGQPFKVGGESLAYPGDPHGSAANTINCRCRVLPSSRLWPDVITPAQQTLARGDQYKAAA